MSPPLVGTLGFVFVLGLMGIGLPIGFAFLFVGFAGTAYLVGIDAGLSALARIPFTWSSEYVFTCIPLFILMGFVFSRSGIAKELYHVAYTWVGRLPGGLALATIIGCGGFAAVSGSSTASAATMGTICYPEMRRYHYDETLASGAISAGGTLGIMIPPSLGFILFGILTEESIGKLFIAGIIPGILEVIGYCLVILLWVKWKPSVAPLAPANISWRNRFVALILVWPILAIFLLILGGLYLGIFTPIEAGGIGAGGTIVIAVIKKRLTLHGFLMALLDTSRVTVMIFLLVMGAMVFNVFMALSNLPQALGQLLNSIGSPSLQLILILFLYFPLGMFMEVTAMFVLTLPLYLPTLLANNVNLIWYGVLTVRCSEIALITPPVGMNVYVVQGVIKDIPVERIFQGIIPFLILDVLLLMVLYLFPQLSLFLPGMMQF